jgi:tetratricopeptide (TPR) repeat protein
MRKLTAGLVLVFIGISFFSGLPVAAPSYAQKAEIDVEEEANILFDEAILLKKQGNIKEAVAAYHQAMRKDRSILAYDDNGLIEDLKNEYEDRIKDDPENVKNIETLAFVYAVCYSDYSSAIKYYEKVVELVDDEKVKENTQNLIERLRLTAEIQQEYQAEVAAQMREERLQTWSEMEKNQRLGEEQAEVRDKSARLTEMYKQKDSLSNRVPQLEKELKELNEEYDKANRLWFATNKDLYYRRRRRLKDDIAAKEQEVEAARQQLEEVESTTASLEREVQVVQQQNEESPIRTYDSYQPPATEGDSEATPPSANDYGDPDDADDEQESLPVVDNPDFPQENPDLYNAPEDETAEEREKRLQELINNL